MSTPPGQIFIDPADAMCRLGDDLPWACPYPVRDGCRVTPLIEAADMYPALEHMMLDAEASVWLSFRIFDPAAKLHSGRAKALGLADWADLLRHAVGRGVDVRILLADFEPVLADYLHAGSWSSYRGVRDVIEGLPEADRDRLQLMVVQHEGEMGWGWRQLLRLLLRRRIRKVVDKLLKRKAHEDGGFDTRPGLWRYVDWDGDTPKGWKAGPPPRLWPATYHQKAVVVDGARAILGGLDVDDRRWDDRRHRQRADRTWHDLSALVEGEAARDVARHFIHLWNREIDRYRATVADWIGDSGRSLTLDPLAPLVDAEAGGNSARLGDAEVQLVRTLSVKSASPAAIGPRPGIREIKAAHRNLIRSARRQLYIEGQFFRSKEAADWVEQALRASADLEVIILVANAPEEVAFEGQSDNLAHRHGEHLQARALGRLRRKAGARRVGLFTLAKQQAVTAGEEKFEETRGTAYGSGVIHIHSKLLIADDALCLISSANINGRSFEWDTELGILWREDKTVGDFRRKLWSQLLGESASASAGLAEWREIAAHNAEVEPEQRRGFIVPYQLGRARRFSRPYWFIPDDLV